MEFPNLIDHMIYLCLHKFNLSTEIFMSKMNKNKKESFPHAFLELIKCNFAISIVIAAAHNFIKTFSVVLLNAVLFEKLHEFLLFYCSISVNVQFWKHFF